MYVFKARIKEPNPVGNNFTIETGNYSDPVVPSIKPKSTYKIGQEVLCVDVDGMPVILGEIPGEYTRKNAAGEESISGVSINTKSTPESKFVLDSKFSKVGEFSSSALEPPELLPGDTSIRSSTGNSIKALAGGLNILDSGTARISTNKMTSSVDINCSEFYLNTAMGELSISPQSNGDFSLNFKGNPRISDINPNTQPTGEPLYNVNLTLGRELELTSSNGHGIKVTPNGKIILKGNSLFLQQPGGEIPLHQWPQKNAEKQEIRSNKVSVEADNSIKTSCGGDNEEETSGDKVVSVGRTQRIAINGPDAVRNPLILASPAAVYSKIESILNGGYNVEVGSPLSGGGKYKCKAHGDVHFSSSASNRGGGSIVMDPSAIPNVPANGLWGLVNTSKFSLHSSILPSTPALPVDGLPNAWSTVPPVGLGNPLVTGYMKFAQFQLIFGPMLTGIAAGLTALAADPALTSGKAGAVAAAAAITGALPTIPLTETKTSYINELPV